MPAFLQGAQPLTGKLVDPPVGLLHPDLVGVDKQIGHPCEAVARFLLTASPTAPLLRMAVRYRGQPV
jgi:hypothetical protein